MFITLEILLYFLSKLLLFNYIVKFDSGNKNMIYIHYLNFFLIYLILLMHLNKPNNLIYIQSKIYEYLISEWI